MKKILFFTLVSISLISQLAQSCPYCDTLRRQRMRNIPANEYYINPQVRHQPADMYY